MFDLKRPCANCPFRTDVEPFIRPGRAKEIARSLIDGSVFQCHKTIQHDDETGEHTPARKDQFCAGALTTLLKMGQPNQMMRIGMRTGWDPDQMDMAAPVYKSLGSFINAVAKSSKNNRLPAPLTSGNRSSTLPSRRTTISQETQDMFQDSDSYRCNLRFKPHERKLVEKAARASNGEKVASFAKRIVLEAATKLVGPVTADAKKATAKKPVKKTDSAKKPVKKAVKKKAVAHA